MGVSELVAPEHAVFADSVAIRYLDFNDGYLSPGMLHPSDMLPAIVAAAELKGSSGAAVILGAHVAYETAGSLSDTYPLRNAGWDKGSTTAAGAAMGAGVVLGLNYEQLANALAMAVTPSMALRSTRGGKLSNWKGCATALAATIGLFAARLAERGMTGPPATFEGPHGLNEKVAPLRPLEMEINRSGVSIIEQSSFKFYAAEGGMQNIIPALLSIRDEFDLNDVVKISIDTSFTSWHEIGGGQSQKDHNEKWDPKTRETADHSMPYTAAVALIDGAIDRHSYDPERFSDPALRPLMRKIVVSAKEHLTSDSQSIKSPRRCEITVELADGRRVETATTFQIGHPQNPMSNAQLSEKFQSLASEVCSSEAAAHLEATLWDLEHLTHIGDLTRIYREIAVD
jgi:2-methylcitrate dehydratase